MPRWTERDPDYFNEGVQARRPQATRLTPQRYPNGIARAYPVDKTNETTVIDRRRGYGPMALGPQGRFDSDTRRTAISVNQAPLAHKRNSTASQVPVDPVVKRRPRTGFEAKAVAADRRMFLSKGFPKTIHGTYAAMKPTSSGRFRFSVPSSVVPCIQRSTRREVLFATKKAGGAGSRRPKRRTFTSSISC